MHSFESKHTLPPAKTQVIRRLLSAIHAVVGPDYRITFTLRHNKEYVSTLHITEEVEAGMKVFENKIEDVISELAVLYVERELFQIPPENEDEHDEASRDLVRFREMRKPKK